MVETNHFGRFQGKLEDTSATYRNEWWFRKVEAVMVEGSMEQGCRVWVGVHNILVYVKW